MKRIFKCILFAVVIVPLMIDCGGKSDEKLIKKADKYYAKADSLLREGNTDSAKPEFAEAIQYYEKLIKQFPNSPHRLNAHYQAGLAYASGFQDFHRAVSILQKAVYEYTDGEDAAHCQFMIGFLYANSMSDIDKARSAYTEFLRKYPNHDMAESVKWELKHLGKDINDVFKDVGAESGLEIMDKE